MAFDNPLDEIWSRYELSMACFAVAKRTIADRSKYETLWGKTEFANRRPESEAIDTSRRELDKLVIIALWARFEREIIEYVQNVADTIGNSQSVLFSNALRSKMKSEIERWRIDDILDLFKVLVNSELLGQIRQIKNFRDWIVHQNPANEPRGRGVEAAYGYRILTQVLEFTHGAS